MKSKLQIITCTSATLFLAFAALAQETINPKPDGAQRAIHVRADRLNSPTKASEVIGKEVQNFQNEKLGKVHELALDLESGRIVQVVLSTGGFLGMGDTLTAVPPGALHYDATDKVLHLDVTKEKLKAAPRFDSSKWEDYTQSNKVMEVYVYYGEHAYFDRATYWTTNADRTPVGTLPLHMDGTINTDAPRNVERVRNEEMARNAEATGNVPSTRTSDGTWNWERYSKENAVNSSWPSLGYVQKASKLMGTSVKNLQDQKLGKVENFVIDLPSGRIVAVIISSGGFLGMGDELSAVPPTALRLNAEHDALQLDASKELLANSPHFKPNQWPDLSQPAYVGGVYRAYRVEPYFDESTRTTTGGMNDADNTRQNVRDRDNRTMTPLDQGNSQADLNTTAQIRKEIIADKRMTVNARNVKIITKNGQVTLRGPVSTAEEKRLIGEIANRITHTENVDNQLEILATPMSNNN